MFKLLDKLNLGENTSDPAVYMILALAGTSIFTISFEELNELLSK